MSQVRVHQFEKNLVKQSGIENRLVGTRVKTGQVLKVTHIAGAFDNCATSEYIELGYWNGHEYVELKSAVPAATSKFVHWDGEVYLREGQYIYAYYADVASDEVMKLRANGEYV